MSVLALPEGFAIKPLSTDDIDEAVALIAEHDEDDAEAADESYRRSVLDQFALRQDGRLVGVCGVRAIPDTDGSWWLSWTYLRPELQDRRIGRSMLAQVIARIVERGMRKVFVTTSDQSPQALAFYRAVDFVEELRHKDYYEPGEGIVYLGQRVGAPSSAGEPAADDAAIALGDVGEIDECDGAFFLDWGWADGRGATDADLRGAIERLRRQKARSVFASGPSSATRLRQLLTAGGFRPAGKLADYYADGVDEFHYRLDLA